LDKFIYDNEHDNDYDYHFAANNDIFEYDDDFIEHDHDVEYDHNYNSDDYNESENSWNVCGIFGRKLLGRIAATVLLGQRRAGSGWGMPN
jgi:hypothetical protein